ncbi:hypothetical protein D1007_57385 [Hordeum vulgare]|nr:hypothetical protein D1007_57385 [Hordeum vulgare]
MRSNEESAIHESPDRPPTPPGLSRRCLKARCHRQGPCFFYKCRYFLRPSSLEMIYSARVPLFLSRSRWTLSIVGRPADSFAAATVTGEGQKRSGNRGGDSVGKFD